MSEALNTGRIDGLAQVQTNHRLSAQILAGLVFLFDSKSRKKTITQLELSVRRNRSHLWMAQTFLLRLSTDRMKPTPLGMAIYFIYSVHLNVGRVLLKHAACMKSRIQFLRPYILGMVAYASNASSQEVEARKSEVQGLPPLQNESEAN